MENKKLYTKIAYWYYTLGLTQDEIAKRLSLTRQKVNQIIHSLIELGIVSITINGCDERNFILENYLETRFNLKQAIVIDSYNDENDDRIFKSVANAAARHLERIIQPKSIIGVSWGTTLTSTITQMQYKRKPDCKIIQLIGAQNMSEDALKSDEIVRLLADRLDCPSYMLYAPVIVNNPVTKQALMEEPSIKKSFLYMQSCDIALVGIGELTENATIYKKGLLSKKDVQTLCDDGFCADICINAVMPDGSGSKSCITDRVIGADLNILSKIPNVIAIVSGMQKNKAVMAALKSNCINTLITDSNIANYIMEH